MKNVANYLVLLAMAVVACGKPHTSKMTSLVNGTVFRDNRQYTMTPFATPQACADQQKAIPGTPCSESLHLSTTGAAYRKAGEVSASGSYSVNGDRVYVQLQTPMGSMFLGNMILTISQDGRVMTDQQGKIWVFNE